MFNGNTFSVQYGSEGQGRTGMGSTYTGFLPFNVREGSVGSRYRTEMLAAIGLTEVFASHKHALLVRLGTLAVLYL